MERPNTLNSQNNTRGQQSITDTSQPQDLT